MAAPGMVALGGAMLAARAVRLLARRRAARSLDAGRPAAILGWAGVLRRTGVARTTGVLTAAIALLLVGVQAWSVAGRERAVRAGAENGAAVVLAAQASSPRVLLDAVRAVDPGGDEAMAVVRLPGGDTNPTVLAVDAARADRVLAFGHQDPGGLASILRPGASGAAGPSGPSGSAGAAVLPETLLLRPGVVEVAMRVDALTSPSPLTASVTVERPGTVERGTADAGEDGTSWAELPLGELRPGAHAYRADVPSWCDTGCRLVGLALLHPGSDIAAATADLTITSMSAGNAGSRLVPIDTAFDRPRAWRAGVPDLGAALVQLTPGRELEASLSAPGGVPARIVHGDAPDPLPGMVVAGTSQLDGVVQAIGLDGGLLRVAADAPVPFVPGLGPPRRPGGPRAGAPRDRPHRQR